MCHNRKDEVTLSKNSKRSFKVLNSVFSLASNKLFLVFLDEFSHEVCVLNSAL